MEVENGNLKTSDDDRLIFEHILSWFETYKKERVQADYGIPDIIGTAKNAGNFEGLIRRDLRKEFPNLIFNFDISYADDGFLTIDVFYKNLNEPLEENTITLNLNVETT